MKRKTFSVFMGILLFVCAVFGISATLYAQQQAQFYLEWSIAPPIAWSGGNSDIVMFLSGSELPDRTNFTRPYIDENSLLHGHVWLGSSGWATFDHGVSESGAQAKINCAWVLTGTTTNAGVTCPVSGFAWSEGAGWIALAGNGANKVVYNPNSANLEGFAWSDSLGWVPMFTGKKFDDQLLVSNNGTFLVGSGVLNDNWYKNPTPAASASVNFIGKVAVIGNVAGSRVFEVYNTNQYQNQNVGISYSTLQHANLLNQIRGNIARITRNANPANWKTVPFNGFVYNTEKDYCLNGLWNTTDYCNGTTTNANTNVQLLRTNNTNNSWADTRTIIVRGKDVIIDTDFDDRSSNASTPTPNDLKAIIALKDDAGNGGNVYITNKVSRIYAYIVAEGSVFSGEKKANGTAVLYPNDALMNPFAIPQKQLYINGLVVSKNTVGGAVKTGADRCPVLTPDCNIIDNTPYNYDMGYFRTYNPNIPGQSAIPSARTNLEGTISGATVIIDYNNNILSSPPPALENFQ